MKYEAKKRASALGVCFALLMCGFGCGEGGCAGAPVVDDTAPRPAGAPAVANPASVYCVERGHRLELRQGPGGQVGVCLFSDGTACEEWRFFKGACEPGTCHDKNGLCD